MAHSLEGIECTVQDLKSQISKSPALPTEVIEQILKDVLLKNCLGSLAACIRACSKWYVIGMPLLWRDIRLYHMNRYWDRLTLQFIEESNLSLFIDQAPISALQNIRSLTIRIAESLPSSLDTLLTKLFDSCTRAAQLQCFSLHIDFSCDNESLLPSLTGMHQLANLSSTVESLELTIRLKWQYPMGLHQRSGLGIHLCEILSNVIPKFKHIRIECGGVCELLLSGIEQGESKLETIMINGACREYGSKRGHLCPEHQTNRSFGTSSNDRIFSSVAATAIDAKRHNLLPYLRSFLITGQLARNPLDELSCVLFIERDIVREVTNISPGQSEYIGNSLKWWIRTKEPGISTDIIVHYLEAETFEYRQSWVESLQGWRFPKQSAKTILAKKSGSVWNQTVRERKTAQEVWLEDGYLPTVLALEVFHPEPLIESLSVSGVNVVQPMSRARSTAEGIPHVASDVAGGIATWRWKGRILEGLITVCGMPRRFPP